MPRREVSTTGMRWVTGLAIASLLAAFVLLLLPDGDANVRSRRSDGYSRSALGHNGLIRVLRDIGENVVQRRSMRARETGLLVLAEPMSAIADAQSDHLVDAVDLARETLVVLPKRREVRTVPSSPFDDDPSWVRGTELIPRLDVQSVIADLPIEYDAQPEIERFDEVSSWRAFHGLPQPVVVPPVQLMERQDGVDPLIECREGVLLGLVDGVYVLSDPDLIANHGIGRGANAALVVGILRFLNDDGGAIVFDETVHGHISEPDIFTVAGTFPAVLVSVHLLLFCALVAFAARGRFGAPVPPPPAIASGKGFLIDNVAALLRRGGHHGHSLRRYGRLQTRRAAAKLHAPAGLDDDQLVDWLLAHAPDRDAAEELRDLLSQRHSWKSPDDTVAHARRIRALTETIHHAS